MTSLASKATPLLVRLSGVQKPYHTAEALRGKASATQDSWEFSRMKASVNALIKRKDDR